ncbi:DASH complex subunit Dad3-domain-containing protein [Lanmaoa asiatica]|nr:DASH complex subunit Dad3-domain-containing protein [Lanmaoa asiatica]
MSTPSTTLDVNPYESHPALSTTEAELLWEYAKLAQHIKDLTATAKQLSEQPNHNLLVRLRVLERKMSLVLTLFKASVWGVINEQAATDLSGQYVDTSTTTM